MNVYFSGRVKNNQDGKEYDEALIIDRNKTSQQDLEEHSTIMWESVKLRVRKYISENLLANIDLINRNPELNNT